MKPICIIPIFYVFFCLKLDNSCRGLDLRSLPDTEEGGLQREFSTDIENVRNYILFEYKSAVRPPSETGGPGPVNVSVAMVPQYVEGIEQSEGKFTVLTGVDLYWVDPRLRWNSSMFNNVSCVFLEFQEIWSPEIRFTFSMRDESDLVPRSLVRVCSEGLVHLTDFRRVSRFAKFNTAEFPLDEQRLIVGFAQTSAGHTEVDMHLIDTNYKEIEKRLVLPADWTIKKIRSRRFLLPSMNEVHPQHYAAVYCFLEIRRDPSFIMLNFCVPSFVVTILAVTAIHSAETSSGPRSAKYELGLVSLMSVSVMTLSLTESLPRSAIVTRLHIFYYCMIIAIFSACFVSWVTMMLDKKCKGASGVSNRKKKLRLRILDLVSLTLHMLALFFLMGWFIHGIKSSDTVDGE